MLRPWSTDYPLLSAFTVSLVSFSYCISLSFSCLGSDRGHFGDVNTMVFGITRLYFHCFFLLGRTLPARRYGIHYIGLQGHVRISFHIVLEGLLLSGFLLLFSWVGSVQGVTVSHVLRYLGVGASSRKWVMDGRKVKYLLSLFWESSLLSTPVIIPTCSLIRTLRRSQVSFTRRMGSRYLLCLES